MAMIKSYRLLIILILLFLLLLFAFLWYFYMRETRVSIEIPPAGSDRENCGICHTAESMGIKKMSVHVPVLNWQCTACHVPHDTGEQREKLLALDPKYLCQTCHYFGDRIKKAASTHRPFMNGDCMDCHVPHSSDYPELSRSPLTQLCITCHFVADLNAMRQVHPPFKEGDCLACHRPHLSDYRKLQRADSKRLCYTCHFDRNGELRMPVQHKPFQQGRCTGCHTAHAADARPLLILSRTNICYLCHSDFRDSGGFVHQPVEQGKCLECHRPHAAVEQSLLPLPVMKLCFTCHAGVERQFALPSHHPVFENSDFNCLSCHGAHVGKAIGMLPETGNEFCYTCHDHIRSSYEKMPHNTAAGTAERGSCRNCHLYHGAQYPPLLLKELLALCLDCHPREAMRMHPVGPDYPDPWGNGYTTCISCHGPHGTGLTNSLKKEGDGLCLQCHRWNPINP